MFREIYNRYRANFKEEPILIKAPGRINLIGEHTDYNQGLVMPAAIDKALYFAFGKNETQHELQIWSANYEEFLILEMGKEKTVPAWGNYLQTILHLFMEEDIKVNGINCVFGGDIPIGAGLSSSAALCCGFIFGLSKLLGLDFSKEKIALMAQQAENRIGVNCGLMDQYAILFGKAGHVFQLDCKSLKFEYFELDLKDHSLVLIDSKIEHQLATDSAYNERRTSCEHVVAHIAAAAYPEIKSLRDVSMKLLLQFENQLSAIDFKRAKYVLAENERVLQMTEAIKNKQLEEFGRILSEGHWGMSQEYDTSLAEIDLLVKFAEQSPSILGARMMGGGFGGCTINLISNKNKHAVLDRIQQQYFEATKINSAIYEITISNGIELTS